ncbi:ubiquitin-protein ligase TUL1 NDAI_0K01810 [Naumovozyma dairenensis CBS 421]|uniref:RING-type E3 ubiquitin transferase n=1 Tax=Naumovozyma dairenensis (strain ATCC 10597 / BCRC 20456 / CBS 421 / NBRC 0211 / NRRL Y-12639) TaxID=1071378 RepID=G0WHW1_NAUDC|nr:hypothetical protein NDAI_0K01810 [Naumovozyma dairenensis CBS 421]CCD27372.1 hypothetical protein NDAI_0K01810 [Naumovozyma dairenensis CBS 421]
MEINGNTLVFLILILFLFFSSPGGDGVASQYEFTQLEKLRNQFTTEYESFQNMTYTDNFRNITGFKLSYQDIITNREINATYPIENKDYTHWANNQTYLLLPDRLIDTINTKVWSTPGGSPNNIFPPNITTSMTGHIELVANDEYTPIRMPVPNYFEPPTDFAENNPPGGEQYYDEWPNYGELHNVTFQNGELNIQVTHLDQVHTELNQNAKYKKRFNSQDGRWKLLNLKIEFFDKLEKEKHVSSSIAVYDIRRGRILGMSQSSKFHSLFALPHYMNLRNEENNEIFSEVKLLIKEYWNTSNYVDTLTMSDLDQLYDNALTKCEYMAFLQLEPWSQYTKDQIKQIDDELDWPIGRPVNISHIPPVSIKSGLLYSPDCGVQLQFNDVKGPRTELKVRTIRIHIIIGILLFAAQIYLLLCQMQHTNTPSSINKISFYSFSMINLVDGSLATLYFVAASVLPELYLPLVLSSFLSFILASIFETRYMISIYASQVNEAHVGILTLLRGHLRNEDDHVPRTTIVPDEASISGRLYGRFFFSLIIFIFVVSSSTSWPRKIRMIFEYIAIFALNSYWVPQIFRNTIKGIASRRDRRRNNSPTNRRQNEMPLLWRFILGTTVIRTLPIIYVFTYSANIFRHHRDVTFVVVLSLWLIFQIAILYSQDILGSRWFLPQHSIPEGYTYFKPISLQHSIEHGGGSKDEPYTVDCAICMSPVPVYIEEVEGTHKVDIHSYMVTPCNHIFHTECLENWMGYKLQCPVCRSSLPPL